MEVYNEILLFAGVLIPIVAALVELVKKSVPIKKNYVPIVSVVIGLVVGFLGYIFTDLALDSRLWAGLFAGLAAVGLFEVVNQRSGTTK